MQAKPLHFLTFVLLVSSGLTAMDFKVLASEKAQQVSASIDAAIVAANVDRLHSAITAWLDKHSTKAERASWTRKWEQKVEEDTPASESSWTTTHFFNRCFDSRNLFEAPETVRRNDLFQLGMLYCHIMERGYALPSKLVENMTNSNTDRIIKVLQEYTEVVQK
jgi:hypothetical protein